MGDLVSAPNSVPASSLASSVYTPSLNNSATARDVADLFSQGRDGEATLMLAQAKQDQPQAVQDALDRMVGSSLETPLTTNGSVGLQSVYASPVEVGNTMRQINEARNNPPAMPDTSGLNTEQKFDVYSSIVQTRGNQAARDALARGDKVILGLRTPGSSLDNLGKGRYNDRVVVLSRNAKGETQVEEFNHAQTKPTAQYDAHYSHSPRIAQDRHGRIQTPDVNGDGIGELGELSEGTTEMVQWHHDTTKWAGTNFALRPSLQAIANGVNRVIRDSNYDGNFDSSDVRSNLNKSFEIHAGSSNNTDSGGCTTVRRDDYSKRFVPALGVQSQSSWQYVLTDATPSFSYHAP